MFKGTVLMSFLLLIWVAGLLFISSPAHAVKAFKISNNGGGAQIWFEAEDFDARDSANVYQIRKAEAKLPLEAGTFGDSLTNVVGAALAGTPAADNSWVRYDFNIAAAGGKAGTWYLFGRIISPNNQSDWLWIKGEQGTDVPKTKFANPANEKHRILEETTTTWTWIGGKAKGEGHVRPLIDGNNTMVIFWRQSDNTDEFDTFVWANKEDYNPKDDDYKNAKSGVGGVGVDPKGKVATAWGQLKAQRF